jgi:putative hydrolase of the HAD superfamily
MSGPIEAVVFDVGGVLTIGGRPGHKERLAGQMMGLSAPIQVPDLNQDLKTGAISNSEFVRLVNERYPDAPCALTDSIWSESFRQKDADVLAVRLARRCREAGLRVGILSNVSPGSAAWLREHGHYDGFDPLILSCDVGLAKPDQEIYRLIEERLPDVLPEQILFLDDQEKCCVAAKRRGWSAIRVDTTEQMVRDAEALLGLA